MRTLSHPPNADKPNADFVIHNEGYLPESPLANNGCGCLHLRLIRIDAVRGLLFTTTLPLKEVAPRCGFRDEYHLSRIYRQVTNHTPGQLRRHR